MRGGFLGRILKGVALAVLIALGKEVQPTNALRVSEAYAWLNKPHDDREITQAATEVVATMKDYKPPSVVGLSIENVAKALEWYSETNPPVVLVPGQTYKLSGSTGDLRDGEEVILQKIHLGSGEEDEDEYEVMKLSDQTGASEGRTFFVPTTQVKLTCAGETCGIAFSPEGKKGGRKTLRRRK